MRDWISWNWTILFFAFLFSEWKRNFHVLPNSSAFTQLLCAWSWGLRARKKSPTTKWKSEKEWINWFNSWNRLDSTALVWFVRRHGNDNADRRQICRSRRHKKGSFDWTTISFLIQILINTRRPHFGVVPFVSLPFSLVPSVLISHLHCNAESSAGYFKMPRLPFGIRMQIFRTLADAKSSLKQHHSTCARRFNFLFIFPKYFGHCG